jgi:hypothetical protein
MPYPHSSGGSVPALSRELSCLQNAQDDHDAIRHTYRCGVTPRMLAADNRRWEEIGGGIADLARLIVRQFTESAFGDARPDPTVLAARLSEAIDDLVDEPAWMVIDAAARLAIAGQR